MYVLPDNLREELRKPLGALVSESELFSLLHDTSRVVSVGDVVTYTVLKHDIVPFVCVVDFVTKRSQSSAEIQKKIRLVSGEHLSVVNPAGMISDELWNTMKTVYEHPENAPYCIEVDGEEDLAALAAIYLAPADVTVIYGMPNKGVVVVPATDKNKHKVKEFLDRM